MTDTRDDLGSMPLYVNLQRIFNELTEAGLSRDQPLKPEQLFPFDQIHYHGTDAVRSAADMLRLGPQHRVLEIGSGWGGPARFLAHTTGCHVTALDVQQEMHDVATELTARAGLASRVTHVLGNALDHPLPNISGFEKSAGFDAVVSWLAIHHIPERPRLFKRLSAALKPGGRIYIEDLYERTPFAAADLPDVKHTIHGVSMTSVEDYVREMREGGFIDFDVTDMTESWTAFCAGRLAGWQSNRDRHVRVHGADTYARLEEFFQAVTRLFQNGSLGGLRLVARASM